MKKLEKCFKGHEIPELFKELYAFDGAYDEYSKSFYMIPDDDMCAFINEGNVEFSSKMIEFAQGGESFASYALWLYAEGCDLANTPIVFMDSDSGPNLIAKNIEDFLTILSYDEDCGGDYFYKDCEDYEMSDKHKAYVKWLSKRGIKTISSCDDEDNDLGYAEVATLIKEANEIYGDSFQRWLYPINNQGSELELDNSQD